MGEDNSGLKVTASDALEFEPVAPKLKKAGSILKTFLFVVIAVGGGAAGWAFYGERVMSLMAGSQSEIPVVRAKLGPIKVRPDNPGGLQVPDRDKLVYNRMQGSRAPADASPPVERLLPPPETPLPKPVVTKVPEEKTAPVTSGKISVPPIKPKRINQTPRVADVTRAEKPAVPPPAPVAKSTPPTPVKSRPAVPKIIKSATPVRRPLDGKSYKVQLAAARTPSAARAEWDKLRNKNLDVLGDLGLSVTKVDLGAAKGVFYRLRAGPLKAEAEARALCKTLAKRKVSCLIVLPGK